MKKLKFVCFGLMIIFLLFFGVFSFSVDVKAAIDEWGAPESAKDFYDFDGKGIRLYFHQVWVDEFDFFEYANLVAIKDYEFDDGFLDEGSIYDFGRNFFDAYLLDYVIPYYLDTWGSGITIPEWDRAYVYFQPWNQLFTFEFRGSGLEYAAYCIEYYYYDGFDTGFDYGREDGLQDGYDYGYDYGYDVGYDYGYDVGFFDAYVEYIEAYDLGYDDGYYEGYIDGLYISECGPIYEQGFADGQESKLVQNNEAFYSGIEKWLVPAIITVIALGGFVTIAARKRRDE